MERRHRRDGDQETKKKGGREREERKDRGKREKEKERKCGGRRREMGSTASETVFL